MKFSISLNCKTITRRRRAPTGLNFQFIRKGFSLIEFLIVISIIGILVGISIPVFKQFQPSLQLNGAVRNLVTDLRYTQQLTVTEQVEYCLQLFKSEKKYQIIQCGETQPIKEVSLPGEIIELTINPALANDEVRYNPYGAVKEHANITLKNTENETKTIEVRPSGFIKTTD